MTPTLGMFWFNWFSLLLIFVAIGGFVWLIRLVQESKAPRGAIILAIIQYIMGAVILIKCAPMLLRTLQTTFDGSLFGQSSDHYLFSLIEQLILWSTMLVALVGSVGLIQTRRWGVEGRNLVLRLDDRRCPDRHTLCCWHCVFLELLRTQPASG